MTNDYFKPFIGKNVDEVLSEFQLENAYEIIVKIPEGSITTMDFRDRVRIWYDPKTNKVSRITTG